MQREYAPACFARIVTSVTFLLPLGDAVLKSLLEEPPLPKGGEVTMKTLLVVLLAGTALFLGACASTHPKMPVQPSRDIVFFEGSF